jgi:hypothetical protein
MPGDFNSRSEVAMGFIVGFQKKMYTTMWMIGRNADFVPMLEGGAVK